MSKPDPLIAFFRDCLRDERSRSGIVNVFGSRVLNRHFVTGDEEATAHEFASLFIRPSIKGDLVQKARLRGRDTEFLYGTLFLAGRIGEGKIACPLLLYPIKTDHDDLALALDQVRINPALFSDLGLPQSAESDLLGLIGDGHLSAVSPVLLAKELRNHLPELEISALDSFPLLTTSGAVSEASEREGVSILPASCVLIVERSKNVAGLLQELEEMAVMNRENFSNPLRAFLDPEWPGSLTESEKGRPEFIPALLADAQLSLIESVNRADLTACQGPPGTGKSFTIAAAAAEQVLRGRSVLICCRTNEAADVLHEKIKALVPSSQLIVRAGRRRHLRRLLDKLTRLMAKKGMFPNKRHHDELDEQLSRAVEGIYGQEKWIEKEIDDALAKGSWFQSPPDSWWTRVRKWVHLKTFTGSPLLARVAGTFRELHEKRFKKAVAFNRSLHLKNQAAALADSGVIAVLRAYQKALRHRHSADQEKALHQLDPIPLLKILPVWITTTDDLHRVLPLKRDLFDLAIMDEATQCDLPSALPTLHRARRALITGDPKQLRHISFLSRERQNQLADFHQISQSQREELDYRDVSAIDRALSDVVGTSSHIVLNEHFRSLPDLIRFSNEHFYNGDLHLMREPEQLWREELPLQFLPVSGHRDSNGVNHAELDAAIRELTAFLNGTRQGSVGFLSPFRAQVDAFLHRLREKFSTQDVNTLIKKHHLVIGTGHSFQGDERDHVILSLAITGNCPAGARRFVERPDVFNVSITRARQSMSVIHSLDPDRLPPESLLLTYLRSEKGEVIPPKNPAPSLADLIPTLAAIGWQPVPRTTLAGVNIDLLIQNGSQLVAIDLIGTGGEEGCALPLAKALVLNRSGVPLIPLRIDEWLHRKGEVVELLHEFLPKLE